jgi:hypothetical protein
MWIRRLSMILAVIAAAVSALTVTAPAASAHVGCTPGEFHRVTSRSHTFVQVDAVQLVNRRSGAATLSAQVGQSHTSTRSFTGTITTSVEGGFWIFAKASASASAGITIQSSSTMSASYTATVTVPGHSTRTVQFGFRRYNQYIQQYHLYNNTPYSCAVAVDHAGWVRAPYEKAFIVS